MLVTCEKCGKRQEVNPATIDSRKPKVKCKSCNHWISVPLKPKGTGAGRKSKPAAESNQANAPQKPFKGIGLRGKLMIFFLVPLILALAVGAVFTLRQMDALGKAMTSESLKMLIRVSENEVMEYSKAMATQIQVYLAGHPDLKKEDFNNDIEFKKIAVQRINLTMRGYTSLFEPTEDGKAIFWAHVNPKYVGHDIDSLREFIGGGFNNFSRIIRVSRGGIETNGHFVQDTEGRPQDNFLVCSPIKGTPYYVSCTTYLDESTLGVVAIPMSPEFKNYLDLIIWPQENEWWKKKEQQSTSVEVKEVNFVMEDKEDFPNVMGNGSEIDWKKPGVAVEVLKEVEKIVGVKFNFKRAPWKRVIEIELKEGFSDGAFPASYKKEREVFGAYPTKNGAVDPTKRYWTLAYSYFKKKGININWDGNNLIGFKGIIGAPLGYSIVGDLKAKGYTVEEAASLNSMKKLILGRIQLVATLEMTGDRILETESEVKGKIEKLVPPIVKKDYYVMLSHQFVKANPILADKIWVAIGELREKELNKILEKY